jgi:heptosyltransferase-3
MLEDHPSIAQVHTIDRGWKRSGLLKQFMSESRLVSSLRARRYDLVVHLTEHRRGAWLTRLLSPRYSVARELPRANWLWRKSFSHFYRLPLATPRHTVECNLDALRRVGLQPLPGEKALVLRAGPAASARIPTLLAAQGLAPRRFIQVHPGSRWLFKCWPADHMAALVTALVGDGWSIALTGAPDVREQSLVKGILAGLDLNTRKHVHDLSGKLSLKELAAVTSHARLFIGVDSAPMHIASAVGTPVVALFGPSGDVEWGPWQVPQRVVASKIHPCRPCGIDGCGGGKISECLTSLPVTRVHAAARDLLAETQEIRL